MQLLTIQLHRIQQQFRQSEATYRGFVGGRGSGKSWVGAYDLLRRAKSNRLYLVGAPTFEVLKQSTWRTLTSLAKKLGVFKSWNKAEMVMTLGNGAEILGRSAENPERFRGPNLSGAWLDEGSQVSRDAFDLLIPCLREGSEQGWLSCTFTPMGKRHWTYEVFGKAGKDGSTALFHATTRQNPFNPASFYDLIKTHYAPLRAEQELEGKFVDLEGREWPSDWFDDDIWFDEWPRAEAMRIIALDPSKGKHAKHGDYSAFVKTMWHDGVLWVDADLERRNVAVIASTAVEMQRQWRPKYFAVETNQFQELLADEIGRLCEASDLFWPRTDVNHSIDKTVRIRRLTPYLFPRPGKPRMIRFKANSRGAALLVDQMQEFPLGDHDDGPDALEMAVDVLNFALGHDGIELPERMVA